MYLYLIKTYKTQQHKNTSKYLDNFTKKSKILQYCLESPKYLVLLLQFCFFILKEYFGQIVKRGRVEPQLVFFNF